MGMIKCPQTGHAIPTGIKSDPENFLRSIVFFGNTHCPLCRANHNWFAREAWVEEPVVRTKVDLGEAIVVGQPTPTVFPHPASEPPSFKAYRGSDEPRYEG